jgi:CHASE2 domain-containing sensor protein
VWWRVCARAVWRARYVIVGVSSLTTLLHHYHLLYSLESAALDANIVWSEPPAANTVIVTINDQDYVDLFDGRSPLDRGRLQSIIAWILSGHPATLGVDIVTAEPNDKTLTRDLDASRIVWVRDAVPISEANAETGTESKWRLDPVLGVDTPSREWVNGLSLFPRDADGFVRRYYRWLSLPGANENERIVEPSFAWAVLRHYCQTQGSQPPCARITRLAEERTQEPLWFNFAGDRYTFRKIAAGAVERMIAAHVPPPPEFTGNIVLFGGTFVAARDTYPTLLGERSGVELTAFAIESELKGGGIRQSNYWLMLVAEIAAGIVLVCLNCFWPPTSRLNVITTGGGIIALALAGSLVAFHAFSYWGSFIPIGVAVWLHEFYDTVEVASHERQELERYRQRYGPL